MYQVNLWDQRISIRKENKNHLGCQVQWNSDQGRQIRVIDQIYELKSIIEHQTIIQIYYSFGVKDSKRTYCSDIVLIELDIMGKQWRLESGCYSCQQIHEPRQGTKGNTEKRNISYLRVKIKNESFIGKQTSRIFSLLWEPIHRPKKKERVN